MTENLNRTPYELMGGEATVLLLVDKFYLYMDTLPEAKNVRKVHAESLAGAKSKLFKFLSGWLGGPDLFVQEYGHPRLRQRHFPFAIGQLERDQWMLCMNKAMGELSMNLELKANLLESLDQLATHMINQ
ncbi:MAG: group II truncated hemoglobin [Methylococcales bacterium]|nr:group II truncated hemoglobin [Methylococcales bacterium]